MPHRKKHFLSFFPRFPSVIDIMEARVKQTRTRAHAHNTGINHRSRNIHINISIIHVPRTPQSRFNSAWVDQSEARLDAGAGFTEM